MFAPWRSQILHLLQNHSLGCVLLCYLLIYNPEVLSIYCVVPENIHTPPFPPRKATEILRVGGSKRRQVLKGWGVSYRGFFLRGLGKIGKLLINNLSVKQAISYFTVTGVFTC